MFKNKQSGVAAGEHKNAKLLEIINYAYRKGVTREPRWDVLKSFEVRATGYPCFPPSRHDSKRSLNEMKMRENRIYGEKMAAGLTINKGHSETSVPFRSPLTVVLGRSSIPIKDQRSKLTVESEDELRAIRVGPTEVMRIFTDRYEIKAERKNRFTPFKDNNMSGPGAWAREHEVLEKQLAKIDRKYKFHSESSSGTNADNFFEKIKELPEALGRKNEQYASTVVQTINTRLKKEEMGGELGEHIRSRRYRKEMTDELREARSNKGVVNFNEYSNRSSLVPSFPVTLSRAESSDKQEERQESKFSGSSHRTRDEEGFRKRAKSIRNPTDQAIIDWRRQTAIDSRIASQSLGSIRASNTEVGRKKKRQKEEDDRESRWSGELKNSPSTKHVRNTTDINVADTRSAKITLRRLLKETALSKAKDSSGDEAKERPAARRRKIRKKCSELLASKGDNTEQGDEKQPNKTTHVRLVPKMSMTSIPGNLRTEGNRAHQKEWSPVRPAARKQSMRVSTSELLSVANEDSRTGEPESRKSSGYKPEMFGQGRASPKDEQRRKLIGDEVLSYESGKKMGGENQSSAGTPTPRDQNTVIGSFSSKKMFRQGRRERRRKSLGDEVLSFESVMKMKEENRNDSTGTPTPKDQNTELRNKNKSVEFQNTSQDDQISKDGEQQGPSREEADNMTVDVLGRNGLVINSVAPVSVTIVKESQRKSSENKNTDERTLLKEGSRGRKHRKPVTSSDLSYEDSAMLLMTGRQNKEQVKDPVVDLSTKAEEIADTPANEITNKEQLSGENVENSSGQNTSREKKNSALSKDKDISLPPSKNSSDYSEIWKHT